MKQKWTMLDLAVPVAIVIPFIYLANVYNILPQTVATHFNIVGKADAFSNKTSLWLPLSVTSGACILLYLLMRFLPVIDPKKTAKYSADVFKKVGFAAVLLIVSINVFIINAAQTGKFGFIKMFPVLMGVFFIFLGNILNNIKPNYFAGIRTPWTLESEETWRKTHQLGAKIWFAGGFVIVAAGLALPAPYNMFAMLAVLFIMVVVPVGYSYIFYQQTQKNQNKQS